MATSSIFKSVNIRTTKQCGKLIRALETSAKRTVQKRRVTFSRPCSVMTKKEMQEIFGTNDRVQGGKPD